MRWSVALSVGAALAVCVSGCRNCDKVESELRARESDVRELHGELERSEFHNQSLLRELCALRGMPGPSGVIEAPSEPYPVRSLVLGRQTGGQASETLPADDALRVQVEPRDPEGQAIKAPGALTIEAQEVTAEGLKRPLSAWQVSPQELRCKWQNGLFSTGYLMILPWKVWPSTEKVRVIARFQMLDGRTFEADKDVTLRILPEDKRKMVSPPAPAVETPPPETLPFMPKPVSPTPDKPGENTILPTPAPPLLPAPTPVESEGPKLLHGSTGGKVELLKPIPLPPES
jgi:hypothetical protein